MTKPPNPLHGLYVITDAALARQRQLSVVDMVEAAIQGGARLVQYRNKDAPPDVQAKEATALARLCHANDVLFLVNDDVALAQAVAADGVHLGQGDTGLSLARAQLGPERIIGVTCHAQLALARSAQAGGADYVAFGRFFPSRTKPEAPPAEIAVLCQARMELDIPVVAIGGITPANAASLLRCGADMLAVIHGVFAAPDIATAADEYVRLFTLQSPHTSQSVDTQA
ncbi:MAG: thiamine phosphate synthase [Gammaproteobacteria bacterium]